MPLSCSKDRRANKRRAASAWNVLAIGAVSIGGVNTSDFDHMVGLGRQGVSLSAFVEVSYSYPIPQQLLFDPMPCRAAAQRNRGAEQVASKNRVLDLGMNY